MSGLVSNPASLTKDKLKRELEEHDIDFPSDAKKDVYVQLYKKHLLSEKSKLEFSSADESEMPSTPQKQRKKKPSTPGRKSPKKPNAKNMDITDVTALSDEELSSMLKANGIDCGPILDTTRRVYQKKLEKVLSQSVKAEPHVNNTQSNTTTRIERRQLLEFSDTDETDAKPVIPVSNSPRKRQTTSTREKAEVKQEVPKVEPRPVRRLTRETRTREEANDLPKPSQPAPSKPKPKVEPAKSKSALTWAAQITILVIVAIIIWILIQKMETAKKTPIREIP